MTAITFSPDWIFDLTPFDPVPTEPLPGNNGSMAAVMQVVTRKIISGPVNFDRTDFYGWTALSFEEIAKLCTDLNAVPPKHPPNPSDKI